MPAFDPQLNPLNGVPTGDQISLGELLAKAGGALGLYGPHALGLGQFLEGPANALGLTGTPATDTLNAQTDQRYNQLLGALHGGPPASAPTISSVFGNPLLAGMGMNADVTTGVEGIPGIRQTAVDFANPANVNVNNKADLMAKYEAFLDKIINPPREPAPPSHVKDALNTVDQLGFDRPSEAMANIRAHPDWATRWDVDPNRSLQEYKAHKTIHDYVQQTGGYTK